MKGISIKRVTLIICITRDEGVSVHEVINIYTCIYKNGNTCSTCIHVHVPIPLLVTFNMDMLSHMSFYNYHEEKEKTSNLFFPLLYLAMIHCSWMQMQLETLCILYRKK